jgi:epsilon-lactone hydrolase
LGKVLRDSITVEKRVQAVGVAVELTVFGGMRHTWQMFAPMPDEWMASIEASAAFIKAHQA